MEGIAAKQKTSDRNRDYTKKKGRLPPLEERGAYVLKIFNLVGVSVLAVTIGFLLYSPPFDPSRFAKTSNFTTLFSLAKQQFIIVNDWKLNVYEGGDPNGELIVFMHGFPETGLLNFAEHFVHFAQKGYHVIAPDLRGFNTSQKGESEDCNYHKAAHDISQLITHFGHKDAHLVAHDWGGAAAWAFTHMFPDKARSLTVFNCPSLLAFQHFALGWQTFKSWYMFLFQVPVLAEWKLAKDDFAWLIMLGFCSSNPGSYSLDELEMYKKAWSEPGAIHSMIGWYRYFIGDHFPWFDHVSRFFKKYNWDPNQKGKIPTLILWGEKDIFLDVRAAEYSLIQLENAKLVRYPDGTHWLPKDKPKETIDQMEMFYASLT
jgi:pimeloyl-ACP methyl ester carboxylesterase